jgi:hypothetical protein
VKQVTGVLRVVLAAASLVACRPATIEPQAPATVSPALSLSATPAHIPVPAFSPTPPPVVGTAEPAAPTPTPVASTAEPPASPSVSSLALPYVPTADHATGRIRGRLFFPSEYIPPLAVYAVATDGGRFYRVDTRPVPPGEPGYEMPLVEPGTYYVYCYPALLPSLGGGGDGGEVGGAYSYLAACEAGHLPPPPEGCWENPRHDPVPVEVRAGQAVEGVNLLDWYGPSPPPPPDDTSGWPVYANEQLAYQIRYPPHWEVRSERQDETTFGPPYPSPTRGGERDESAEGFASVRVTNGDPEELADALIGSLPPGEVVARQWLPFAGRNSLYLALDLPEGHFAWWFVPRYELVYVVHGVTDSGLGSFDQMVETFTFDDQ